MLSGLKIDRICDAHLGLMREVRDRCASAVQDLSMQDILLAAGEMTAQERRTVKAAQSLFAHKIRLIEV